MAQKFLSVKDLSLFEDGSIELNGSGGEGEGSGLCLVTSTLEVAPAWLVDTVCGRHVGGEDGPQTVLVTFTNRSSLHLKGIKRYSGVDVAHIAKSVFAIVDLSDQLFAIANTGFVAAKLDNLVDVVRKSVVSVGSEKPVIVVEEPDLLLASGLYSWDQVSRFIFDLRQISSQAFVFCNSDEPLIHTVSPIGENQNKFLTQLIHTSSVIISLRPFETGRADDITGILSITRGPHVNPAKTVVENEYLYHVSDSVKLFYR